MNIIKQFIFVSIAAVLLMGGCAGGGPNIQPVHAPVVVDNENAAVKAFRLARDGIDEANAQLTSINRVIAANAKAGVWTKDQAQGYLNQTKAFGKDVDKARAAMLVGDLNDASVRAAAIKALILQLQLEVAKMARGG